MNILRRILAYFAYTLLPTALITFGALFSFHQVFGTPTHIKSALDQSGVYNTAAANVVRSATASNGSSSNDAGQQAVQQAITNAVPPAYVKAQTDQVLNGVFAWLQGNSSQLSFNVNLDPVKTKLADNIAEQAKTRAAALPACTGDQTNILNPNSDPFSLPCLPVGVTPDDVASMARQQVETSDIYKQGNITPQNISQNSNSGGKSLQDQLKPVASIYKDVWKGVLISGIGALLLTAAVVLLSVPRRRGIRRAAMIYLSIGASSIVLAVAAGWVIKTLSSKIAEQNNADLQAKLVDIIRILGDDLRNIWIGYGVALVVLGIGALVALRFIKMSPTSPQNEQKLAAESISDTAEPSAEHNNHGGPTIIAN